jgi:hypothetical protein
MDFAVVPDWVAKTKLFDLGVQDENITVVENASQAADAEIAAREAQPKPPRSVVGSRSSTTAGE